MNVNVHNPGSRSKLMARRTRCGLLVLAVGLLVMACAEEDLEAPEGITITQQTPGQSERFTQFELDVAYRKQALEYARALLDPDKDASFCCVVFQSDIRMLGKVLAHFGEHVSADAIDDYGIHVLENENEYIVLFWERYREEAQYAIESFWHPGVSEDGIRQFGYFVDRETLEILEFSEIAR